MKASFLRFMLRWRLVIQAVLFAILVVLGLQLAGN